MPNNNSDRIFQLLGFIPPRHPALISEIAFDMELSAQSVMSYVRQAQANGYGLVVDGHGASRTVRCRSDTAERIRTHALRYLAENCVDAAAQLWTMRA